MLRCPGPLVALRGLAALYRVSDRQLAAVLPACETRTRAEPGAAAGALRRAVSDALGGPPLTPTAVHYFHAARLLDPWLVLTQGLRPFPTSREAIWRHVGDIVAGDMSTARWASLLPAVDGHAGTALRHAVAARPGPRASLVCDVVLRPTAYGARDHLALPAVVADLSAAYSPIAGFSVAERYARATTPCIVEYRRRPAPGDQAVDAALWYVAAALRGDVSSAALGGHDAHGTPIAGDEIISVRAVTTQREWTHEHL